MRAFYYVVESPGSLPEPDDLNAALGAPKAEAPVDRRALVLTDFTGDGAAWMAAVRDHAFVARRPYLAPVAQVPVVIAASGVIVAPALDRRGSMNRFSGGWSG